MRVTIKPTEPSDIDAIFSIRRDPLVLQQQTAPGLFETKRRFEKRLDGKPNLLGISFGCSTIFADGELVGHVLQHFTYGIDGKAIQCECGWNLRPSFWGQGIMMIALRQLYSELFASHPQMRVCASCLASNHRCKRVMEKVGFVRDPMGVIVGLLHFLRSRGRRVLQYRLDRRLFEQLDLRNP